MRRGEKGGTCGGRVPQSLGFYVSESGLMGQASKGMTPTKLKGMVTPSRASNYSRLLGCPSHALTP